MSVKGKPLVFMPKMPVTSVGGSSMVVTIDSVEVPVALLLHLEVKLLLQQAAAFAQLDDIVIETIEPLRQLAGLQPQRRIEVIGVFLLEPVKQDAQAG